MIVSPRPTQALIDREAQKPPTDGGVDFGFNHPFVALWGHLTDDVLWITGCRSIRQMTVTQHSICLPMGVRWSCDPSRPDSIVELRRAGHDCVPCVHMAVRGGAGSPRTPVLFGIDLVSERIRTGRLMIIRRACLPLIRSLSMYHYDPEKRTEEPVKEDDDEVDALRYLVVGLDRGRAVPAIPETHDPVSLDDEGMWR